MIPVLVVPILNGAHLLERMVASIDVPVDSLIVVDNGRGVADAVARSAWHVRLPHNIGVAASWNLGMRLTPRAPWWAIVNHDVTFEPGALAALAEHVTREPGAVWTLAEYAAFGLSAQVLERVGYFDENLTPAYLEDCDHERRCALAGVPIHRVPASVRHDRSSTIADPIRHAQNARTYPNNRAYYRLKWGGEPRGGETFSTPFDRGGDIRDWTIDPARLRANAWT